MKESSFKLVSIFYKKYCFKHTKYMFGVFALLLILSLVKMINPFVFSKFIDECLLNKNQQLLFVFLFFLILIFLVNHILDFIVKILVVNLKNKIDCDLSMQLLNSLFNKEIAFYERKNTGEILQIALNEIDTIKGLYCDILLQFFALIMELILIFFVVSLYDIRISLLILALGPFACFFQSKYKKKITKMQSHAREAISELSGDLNDSIAGISTIKTNKIQKYRIEGYKSKLIKVINAYNRMIWKDNTYKFVMAAFFFLPVLFICFFAGKEVIKSAMTIGEFTLLYTYSIRLLSPISGMTSLSVGYNKAVVILKRYMEVIEDSYLPNEKDDSRKEINFIDRITIDNLCFSYPKGRKIFENFSLELEKGNIYHIVGDNGAGKTTFFNILVGLINPSLYDGKIIINKQIELNKGINSDILNNISLAPQHPFMFNGLSTKENMLFNKFEDNKELSILAKKFKISDILRENVIVQRNGENLSGGQKQKLSILRTLYRNTDVLIFDEPFKELDAESKKVLCFYLEKIKKNKIILISSHEELDYIDGYIRTLLGG